MSDHKKKRGTANTTGIVVGGGKKPLKIGLRSRLGAVILACIVILIVAVAATLFVVHRAQKSDSQKAKQDAAQKAADALPGKTLQQKINNAVASGKTDEAQNLLDNQGNTQSREMLSNQILVYLNKGEMQKALDLYTKIDTLYKLNQNELASAASIAETLKQNPLAITYYKRAKALVQANSSNPNGDELKRYDAKIQELETKK